MNIFVAGVHGVGKTYLASQIPKNSSLVHTSASKLINEERGRPSWGADKKVSDVHANQTALAAAVKRRNCAGERLLLDGHFVLLSAQGDFQRLGADVFKSLNLIGVVLLETDPHTIVTRIRERDRLESDVDHTIKFMAEERSQAQMVCDELGLSLHILDTPNPNTFAEAIAAMAKLAWTAKPR